MTHGPWVGVAALAAEQHGVVGSAQLVRLGIGESTIRGWVARRRLIRLHAGVFAVGHRHLPAEGHYLAGVLACGEGAVLSHVSAAALWGLRRSVAATIDVTSPIRTGRRKPGLRIHRGDELASDETAWCKGIQCTSVTRTLIDLGAVRRAPVVCSAVEAAERLGLLDVREATILLARHRGRRGVGRLREALASFDEEVMRARSETEARVFHLLVDRGLPRPLVNRVILAGGERFEVDLHWPAHRLILEVDSPFHDTRAAIRRDAHRDSALAESGWTIVRRRGDETLAKPEPLINELRRRTSADGSISTHS